MPRRSSSRRRASARPSGQCSRSASGSPAPQVECLRVGDSGAAVLTPLAQLPAAGDQALEQPDVDLVVPEGQPVAVRRGLDGVVPQGPAQAQDRPLDDLRPGRRRRLAPERVGQPLGRHAVAAVDDERGQHDPVPGREPAVPVHLQGAEQRESHEPTVRGPRYRVNGPDTGLIPRRPLGRYRRYRRCEWSADRRPPTQEVHSVRTTRRNHPDRSSDCAGRHDRSDRSGRRIGHRAGHGSRATTSPRWWRRPRLARRTRRTSTTSTRSSTGTTTRTGASAPDDRPRRPRWRCGRSPLLRPPLKTDNRRNMT